jgi:chemotaxis protein histidine kinase CheA
MAFDQSKFLARFVDEAREHCTRITDGLLTLENAPDDGEVLNALFRSAHTIKGSSRMMKQIGVSELANHIEDVLDALRGGKVALTRPVSDLLFSGVDAVTAMLASVKPNEPPPEPPEVILSRLASAASGTIHVSICDPLPQPLPEMGPATEETECAGAASRPVSDREPPLQPSSLLFPGPTSQQSILQQAGETAARHSAANTATADYLRVKATKLDDLIRLMGEIVSEHGRFRKQVRQLHEVERMATHFNGRLSAVLESVTGGDSAGREMLEAGNALCLSLRQTISFVADETLIRDQLVHDLRETSLKLRMMPLSTVFDSLRRTVRDLAREHGKEIDLEVTGGETELDRKIIERIGDPLIHMIRNSLDHGLESAAERIAAGKPERGTITLSACYDGGCVTVAVGDDGRGLCNDKIREKALAKRLYDAEALGRMSKSEIINMIFLPGFSTSPIITDLSGRGVGMDVVRKNIVDDLKGSIIIDSREGEGTTFFLRLPLNLAILPLFLFKVAGKHCALPATSLTEMVTVRSGEVIDIVQKRAIRLQEQLVPVVNLSALLGIPNGQEQNKDEILMAIVRDCDEKLGLVVDEILGEEELVVKPLPVHMQNLRLVSGVTIGEGHGIITILRVPELFRRARELTDTGSVICSDSQGQTATVLVVDDSINTREIEKSILEAYGYKVCTAVDGEEAWEKTRAERYDLVITDVEMPRLDGFSLTERLRKDERYRHVPVIIVTSRQKDEDKKRGITVGADAYIVKGAFDQSILLETVRSLIG